MHCNRSARELFDARFIWLAIEATDDFGSQVNFQGNRR